MRQNSALNQRSGLMIVAVSVSLVMMAGCANKRSTGASQSTAAMAQAQMLAAEQSTTISTSKTYLGLIEQMQASGHWYAALAHTEAFIREHGATPEVLLLRADALRNTQQYEAAAQVYVGLLGTPKAARAHRGLGLLQAQKGQYAAAIAELEQARKLSPIDAQVLSDIAYAHMRSGLLAPARLPILQAAQLAPNDARVQLNLALFWLASGEQTLGQQLIEKLSQPQGKQSRPLVDRSAIESLHHQLQMVQQAERAAQSQQAGSMVITPVAQSAEDANAAMPEQFATVMHDKEMP